MKKMLVLGLLALLGSSAAFAATQKVYCANGKVEVDTRDLKQMQSARGRAYIIKEFSSRIDADKFAKSIGGVGASCKK